MLKISATGGKISKPLILLWECPMHTYCTWWLCIWRSILSSTHLRLGRRYVYSCCHYCMVFSGISIVYRAPQEPLVTTKSPWTVLWPTGNYEYIQFSLPLLPTVPRHSEWYERTLSWDTGCCITKLLVTSHSIAGGLGTVERGFKWFIMDPNIPKIVAILSQMGRCFVHWR